MRVSVVVPAFNEERNIRRLLGTVLAQRLAAGVLLEVVVVASGCTDGTCAEVRAVMAEDARVRLIVQDARLGKAAAINAYLRERDPTAELVIISSADILVQPGCMELLVRAFVADARLGMCGGRPVPTNPRSDLLGRMVGFLWDLHHERALESPKLGEFVAVRAALLHALPLQTAVDEASIEASITQQGYRLGYVPEAVITNRGPERLVEYFEQRRRIAAGHYWLKDSSGYTVSTLNVRRVARLAVGYFTLTSPGVDSAYLMAIGVEAVARGVGYLDARRNFSHAVWRVAESAHKPVPEGDVIHLAPRGTTNFREVEREGNAAEGAPAARVQ
ncbi:glycosyltransferase [Myxococcaceae bacterium GXIMD 01537]